MNECSSDNSNAGQSGQAETDTDHPIPLNHTSLLGKARFWAHGVMNNAWRFTPPDCVGTYYPYSCREAGHNTQPGDKTAKHQVCQFCSDHQDLQKKTSIDPELAGLEIVGWFLLGTAVILALIVSARFYPHHYWPIAIMALALVGLIIACFCWHVDRRKLMVAKNREQIWRGHVVDRLQAVFGTTVWPMDKGVVDAYVARVYAEATGAAAAQVAAFVYGASEHQKTLGLVAQLVSDNAERPITKTRVEKRLTDIRDLLDRSPWPQPEHEIEARAKLIVAFAAATDDAAMQHEFAKAVSEYRQMLALAEQTVIHRGQAIFVSAVTGVSYDDAAASLKE